jgi:hypothetical protein
MPRYFFNLDNSERSEDDVGTMLSGPGEARTQAVLFAGEYLRDNPELVGEGDRMRVEVRDEQDNLLFEVVVSAHDPDATADPMPVHDRPRRDDA